MTFTVEALDDGERTGLIVRRNVRPLKESNRPNRSEQEAFDASDACWLYAVAFHFKTNASDRARHWHEKVVFEEGQP